MNVLVVCASNYPDMDEVRRRLERGTSNPVHTTYVRRSDRVLKPILEGIGARYSTFEPDSSLWFWVVTATYYKNVRAWKRKPWKISGDAYNEQACNFADKVIVYHTEKSGVTGYFVKRLAKFPYMADKIEVTTKKPRAIKTRPKVQVPHAD